jgi:hypothetical protein
MTQSVIQEESKMDIFAKFSAPGIFFLVTLTFGFLLSGAGKPYNGILFNIHKLIALATVILTAIQIYNYLKITNTQVLPTIFLILAGLCIVALFATGALMSMGKLSYDGTLALHRVASILFTITIVMGIYLLGEIKL